MTTRGNYDSDVEKIHDSEIPLASDDSISEASDYLHRWTKRLLTLGVESRGLLQSIFIILSMATKACLLQVFGQSLLQSVQTNSLERSFSSGSPLTSIFFRELSDQ